MKTKYNLKFLCITMFVIFAGITQLRSQATWNTSATLNTNSRGTEFSRIGTASNAPILKKDFQFWTNGVLRTTLFSGTAIQPGRLAIHLNPGAPITAPVSMLHIGQATNLGSRTWMNVGTTYTEQLDLMYVGIKNEGPDQGNAVISWADNSAGAAGPDVLRFIFTASLGPFGLSGTQNGAEMARMTGFGTTGFGNFRVTNIQPVRRVEILDADPNTGNKANAPQLRLTYTQNANPTFGVFTEFQTTSLGDMYFNSRSNAIARRFGFHDNTPGNTVEITSQTGVPYFGSVNGSSGLRFTNLRSSHIPIPNGTNGVNSAKVLTVDILGNVVLTNAGIAAANNGISINAGVVQFGGACNNAAAITASQFTASRALNLNNNNLEFRNGRVGFGTATCAPIDRVQITGLAANRSGLTFTNLTSASPTVPNGTSGVNSTIVLTVTSTGEVVLTDATGGGAGGGICGTNPPALTNNWEIPLGTKNYVFTGQDAVGSNVGIGTTCSPFAKLEVHQNSNFLGGYFLCDYPDPTNSNLFNIGVLARAINCSETNIGVFGAADDNVIATRNIGVYGVASNAANENKGGYFLADGTGTSNNVAIWAEVNQNNPNSFAGDFEGKVIINGDINGVGTFNYVSDQQFKTNIDTIGNAIEIIKQMKPKTFDFDTTNIYGMNFSSQKQYGLIAQQVATILPELVSDIKKPAVIDTAGNVVHPAITYKSLNYNAFIAILMKGMQEQQKTIDSLKAITNLTGITNKQDSINVALQNQINQLTSNMNSCCNNIFNGFGFSNNVKEDSNQTDVELNNSQSIVLEQNVPNPFAEETTINYFLPENTLKAQMLFYDARGILIKSVDLVKNGKGTLNVFAHDLTSGIYTYTLVADGNIVESKRMVKE